MVQIILNYRRNLFGNLFHRKLLYFTSKIILIYAKARKKIAKRNIYPSLSVNNEQDLLHLKYSVSFQISLNVSY